MSQVRTGGRLPVAEAYQVAFVQWWDEKVKRPGGDTRSESIVSRSDTMDVAGAEASTGVTKLQVSRWRKHLANKPRYRKPTASQRAMVAANLANRPKGSNHHASIEAMSQDQAADMLGVSRSTVQRAVIVLQSGDEELIEAVEQGDIAVSAAAARVASQRRRECSPGDDA